MYEHKYHTQDLHSYKFLVTGGAGFIGSNLVEYLLKYNAGKVVVLDNFSTGCFSNIESFIENPRFSFINGDVRDINTCIKATKGIDFVLHQAALGSVPRSINDPITTNEVNISGFLNMLNVAKESESVKRFIYAASSSTYGDHVDLPKKEENIGNPLSPYAVTKYVNELYADVFWRSYGLKSTGLRYFNVFGPKQSPKGAYAAVIPLFLSKALNDQPVKIYGDGKQTRDFTFIENVVQANIKALFFETDRHQVFNIAYGDRVSINELWATIKNLTKSKSKVEYFDERTGDVKDSLANINKAKNILTYRPTYDLRSGLKITNKFFQKTTF